MQFPNPLEADDDGLVAVSEEITPNMVYNAYCSGIFPWPIDDEYVYWFSPNPRAIVHFDNFRIPKTVKRELKKCNFKFTFNQQFDNVIEHCSKLKRRNEEGTWITPKIIECYKEFHKLGFAVSCEVLDVDNNDKLVGGLYGVLLNNNYFAGESMFNTVDHAAKFALVNMVEYLKENYDISWIDCQVLNPFLGRFGVYEVSREKFVDKINGCNFLQPQ
ncbi:leucyl/phenylalanyl-tRNA--protein transferase [Lentisphaerota bacterium WC36G]|nr:leucyl/phenylalanyl-tRNA--protein transferase [Lentisphaerae bacterium WC36]